MPHQTTPHNSASIPRLILASTSRYRAELLQRLGIGFDQLAPGVDEKPVAGESPKVRALRLAVAKTDAVARSIAGSHTLVVGSDQVAALNGDVLDKPGTYENALAQLTASSGQTVTFHTAMCLIDTRDARQWTHIDETTVHFRPLSGEEIERYLHSEQPLDCAGSFKCEGLGISLFERIDSQDPTALIGLPLMTLARMLRDCGMLIP